MALHAPWLSPTKRHEPETIYGALVAEDGVTFIHCMAFPTPEAEGRHRQAEYTKRFVEEPSPLCDEEPVLSTVHVGRTTKPDFSEWGCAESRDARARPVGGGACVARRYTPL